MRFSGSRPLLIAVLLVLVAVLSVLVDASPARAEPLDLVPFARVTATDTLDTFFLLWPRETDDGAFTVRDGAPETSWKIPYVGTHALRFDFAPTLVDALPFAGVEAVWETPPAGDVRVQMRPDCGGPVSADLPWPDPATPLMLDPSIRGRCLDIVVTDAAFAALAEVRIFAADNSGGPALNDARLTSDFGGVHITWSAGEATRFVRIDYLDTPDEGVSGETRVEVVPAREGGWSGPYPARESARIVVTPLTVAGEAGKAVTLDPPTVDDLPFDPYLGTIEGYYGTPWSDGERRRMMLQLARLGFGSYLYQPKWDLLNREQWRTPYSEEQIERFAALRRFGERVGVTMIFGLGPAFDMIVDDPGERETLIDKLAPLVEAGFRDFELGFDDIEFSVSDPVDGAMGAKHVDLVNWTREQLGAFAGEPVRMWMMPTPYSTDRQFNVFPDGSDYLDQLAGLDESVRVLWNGPDTFARDISAADLVDVTQRIGRKPVIWENMHCPDAGDAFIGKFYLAPVMNRAADMPDAAEGFMTNPLITGAANRLILPSYRAYWSDPAGYDPEAAMPRAVSMETTDVWDRELLLRMSENYWGLGILGPPGSSVTHNRPMDAAMDALRAVREGAELAPIVAAGARLLRVAASMAVTHDDLHHSGLRPDLVDDLWYPAERIVADGRALLLLLDGFGRRLAGLDDSEEIAAAEHLIVQGLLHIRFHTSLLRVLAFKRQMERVEPAATGFEKPAIAEPASRVALVGEVWRYDTGTPGRLDVFGLAGASKRDGVIEWRPAHAGVYRAIVTVETGQGWAWSEFEVSAHDLPSWNRDADDDDVEDDDDTTGDDDTNGDDEDMELDGETGGCGC